MDLVHMHDRGSMDLVHESGPLAHVLSSPDFQRQVQKLDRINSDCQSGSDLLGSTQVE